MLTFGLQHLPQHTRQGMFFFSGESNLPHPAEEFSCCFGCPYDILVVMDDRATENVAPYKPQQKSNSYLHGIALGALLFF